MDSQTDHQHQPLDLAKISVVKAKSDFNKPTVKNPFFWVKGWKIVETAHQTAQNQNSPQDMREKLLKYIAQEFPELTNQSLNHKVCSVPDKFVLSNDKKDGERAEELVFNKLKELEKKIPDLKMVFINGLRKGFQRKKNSNGF